jgi:hypothetical protein
MRKVDLSHKGSGVKALIIFEVRKLYFPSPLVGEGGTSEAKWRVRGI